eukprot:7614279-Pyramimonas_sp.AAC.1
MWLSSKLKGLMLEEGAQLTQQSMQNLRTLTKGRLDYDSVSWALRQMDAAGSERLMSGRPNAALFGAEDEDPGD